MLQILNIIKWGVLPETPSILANRIILVNVFALLAAAATLPYVFIFYSQGIVLTSLSIFFFLCFVSIWFFNKFNKFNIAKISLYVLAHLYLFTTASAFGREAGEHLVLIPVLFGAVLVFEFKEKFSLLFAFFLTLVTFLVLELTEYSLFQVEITPQERLEYYYGNLLITLISSLTIAIFYYYLYGKQLEENRTMIEMSKEIENTINYFSSSLFGKNTVDEILWDVTKNCISQFGFVDCVIYLLDENKKILYQKAAYGAKNPTDFDIYTPIKIPVGSGIVGYVAKTGKSLVVGDTSKTSKYIVDDIVRLSEIAVPLKHKNKVIGVIDSEHPDKNYFTENHLSVLKTIASLCANKIVGAWADEEKEVALKIKLESEKIKSFDKLKSNLYANVSHELRTPLTLIMGTIDKNTIKTKTDDWQLMKRHTNRLLRLINQLLDLTKLESGEFKLHPKSGDIMGFISMILVMVSSSATKRNISLVSNIKNKPLWLNFDHDALEKIIYNLLSNAIKFTKENSTIKININYDHKLYIKITDQGEGIELENQHKIFDRYFQTGTNTSGTGIGLSLTKELVELHQGKIEVESTLYKGTTFTVSLPLQMVEVPNLKLAEPDTTYPQHIEDPYNDEEKQDVILLVEDDPELAEFIKSGLDTNFKIILAANGEQAIGEVKTLIPDLIISDIMMPKMDGIEFCSWIKQQEMTSHIPVVLLTALADMNTKLKGLRHGADDYIIKPFNAEELRTRIENLLAQRKQLKIKFNKISFLSSQDIVISSTEEVFIKKLLTIIEQNLDQSEFTVDQLCHELATSRMQLHRKLKALTGHSASSFIRNQRLLRASKLLEVGEPVSQVAYAVGFSSLSYFTNKFKEQFGVVPSEYSTHVIN